MSVSIKRILLFISMLMNMATVYGMECSEGDGAEGRSIMQNMIDRVCECCESLHRMAIVSKLHMRVTMIGDIALWLPEGVNKKKMQNGPIVNSYGADIQARVLLGDIK